MVLYRWLRWLITLGVLAWLAWTAARDWPSVRDLRWSGHPVDAVLASLLTIGGLLTLPLGLRGLVRRTEGAQEGAIGLYVWRIWLQAFVYRYVPGKVVLVAERIRLGQAIGLTAATSTVLVLWESVFQLLGGCLVIAVLVLFVGGRSMSLASGVVAGAIVGVALLSALPIGLRWLEGTAFFRQRIGAVDSPKLSPSASVTLVAGYAAAWLQLGLGFFFVGRFFFELEAERAPEFVLWYVAAYVLGWLSSVAPAGLGLREGIVVFGLGSTLGSGPAVALATASRLWATVAELLCSWASTRIPPPPTSGDQKSSTSIQS